MSEETNATTDTDIGVELDDVLDAATEAAEPENPIRGALAGTIQKTMGLQNRIRALNEELHTRNEEYLRSQGQQEAFWAVFLNGRQITADEAIAQNLDGIKDALNQGAQDT